MRSKKAVTVIAVLAVLCLALGGFLLYTNRERPLMEVCPAIAVWNCSNAKITWQEGSGDGAITPALSGQEFHDIFAAAHVKKGPSYTLEPVPAFLIRLVDGTRGYILIAGQDHSISVASLDDLNSRTFWTDTGGELFSQLYTCHLNNGGQPIPET